jgi:hypothetical protein
VEGRPGCQPRRGRYGTGTRGDAARAATTHSKAGEARKTAGVAARPNARARGQLASGRKPESSAIAAAEAAEIPERSLIRATDVLRVRTQPGSVAAAGVSKMPGCPELRDRS